VLVKSQDNEEKTKRIAKEIFQRKSKGNDRQIWESDCNDTHVDACKRRYLQSIPLQVHNSIMAKMVIMTALGVVQTLQNTIYRQSIFYAQRVTPYMPTVSLNERGVAVRGCDSSIPVSRSLCCSVADGGGADTGVNCENGGRRLPSGGADTTNEGDSVSVTLSPGCFSSSNLDGLLRFFLLDDDSEPASFCVF